MAKVFTSDPHFGHKNIVKFTDRKLFTTQEDHDEWLIRLYNSQISNEDTVYCLGDTFFHQRKAEKIMEIVSRLNGQWVFIKGNHDDRKAFKAAGLELRDMTHTTVGTSTKAILSHFPFAIWWDNHYGSIHLHGHCHGNYQGQGKILDVGLDNSYKLYGQHRVFTEEDILEFMSKRQVVCLDHHGTERN